MTQKTRNLLIRSSWQTVNIGDIGHTPGLLCMLEKYLPDMSVTLWAFHVDNGVDKMLYARFPKLKIVQGKLVDGKADNPALAEAVELADLLLHGSGPGIVAREDLETWRKWIGKPYGIYGVTVDPVHDQLLPLLNEARFIYCRDTITRDALMSRQVTSPVITFGPDATFDSDLVNDAKAKNYLQHVGLADKTFVCFIPRLRYTPYFQIHHFQPNEEQQQRHQISLKHCETDHAKLRHAITRFVRETGHHVLICPEMTYEVQLGQEVLFEPLPDDVKQKVVARDCYWLPDEAASIYRHATAMVSFEMHSPILAHRMGTPAILVRQPTDTCKGQMWRDVQLADWMFEVDETDGNEIANRLTDIVTCPEQTREKLKASRTYVDRCMKEASQTISNELK